MKITILKNYRDKETLRNVEIEALVQILLKHRERPHYFVRFTYLNDKQYKCDIAELQKLFEKDKE